MKILLPTIYHPFIGGITIHIDNLIKNLNDIDDYEFYILNYKSNINIPQNINNLNVNVIEVPYIKKIRGLSYLKNGYKIGKKIIEKYDIDLIHSHYAFPQGVLGAKLSKKYNIPNILTLHGSDVLKLSKNPVGKSFFNYAVNNTDKLICVSNFLKQELPATCQNKSTVIYNGVDFNLFNTNNNRDDNYAIFVGSFVPQKGLNLLVDVIKDIDYNFKFIGDGPLYNSIKNKIKNENLPNNFQGKLSDRSEASIPKSKICEFPHGGENMPKIFRIKGKIVGKDEPMVFTKEYKAMKEEDAIEKIYSEIGSKHHVKRTSIKIVEVSEISVDEVQDPILQAVL